MFTMYQKPIITTLLLLVGCSQSLTDSLVKPSLTDSHTDNQHKKTSISKQSSQPITDSLSNNNTLDTLSVETTPHKTTPIANTLHNLQAITFQQAADYVLTHSDKLLAAQSGWQASQLQAEALDDLHKPTVLVSGMVGRYHVSRDISTSALRDRSSSYGDNLSAKAGGLVQQMPNLAPILSPILSGVQQSIGGAINKIPSEVNISKSDNFSRADVTALMPIYTGGRIDAIQQFAHGRADTYASEVASTEEELFTTLIKRYFQVQLAEQVVKVRKAAVKAIKGHDHAAQRMLDTGLISKVERLHATTALSDAKFQLEKAEDNLRLAKRALNSLLHSPQDITITTDLFVNERKLSPLATFQEKALARYPALAKIKAKAKQANAMKTLSDAAWKPNVSAFGTHQIGDNNDWVIGVNAHWTVHSPVDRDKMQQAAEKSLRQVDAIRRQAKQDINLLVEKNWLAVTDAQHQYKSLAKEEKLAQQVLQLQNLGFKEGLNTVIEVNDARAKLIKTQTLRAKAAYDYVIALSELLASTGDIHAFLEYLPQTH